MQSGRVVLIANPAAGGGRGRRVLDAALPLLREAGLAVQVIVATAESRPRRPDAPPTMRARVVVAVGGDGHAAAVAEGLIGSATSLAVLPAGSANDYAQALGMSRRDLAAAVAVIAAGETALVDTVRVAIEGRER